MICSAFSGILKGVYHERIEYPKVQQFAIKNENKSAPAAAGQPEPKPLSPETAEEEHPAESAKDPAPEKGETNHAD